MQALQLLGEAGPGALSLGGPFLAPRHPGSRTLPSCSAVQFLGSALRGPLSPAEDQDQAGCDLGAGISRRQFSRPWSGELPTGPPVKSRHLELHQSLASVNPRSIACALSRAAGPTGGGAECWTCHGSSGPLDQDLGGSAKVRPACLGHRCRSLVRGCDEGGRPQARCQETQLHP